MDGMLVKINLQCYYDTEIYITFHENHGCQRCAEGGAGLTAEMNTAELEIHFRSAYNKEGEILWLVQNERLSRRNRNPYGSA